MSKWKEVGAGVQMWMPTAEVETESTSRTSSQAITREKDMEERQNGSDRAAGQDHVFPSVDSIDENLRAKQLIYDDLFSTPSQSASIFEDTPAISQIVTASPLSRKDDLVAQLYSFVTPTSSLSLDTGPENLGSTRNSQISTTASSDTYYESDRTDFLECPETPCPTRVSGVNSKKKTKRATNLTSHHFRKPAVVIKEVSVRRQLDFGVPKAPETPFALQKSIRMVRAPEYSPPRRWSDEEHEFMCVLWRWYSRDVRNFTRVFNHRFGLELDQSRVTTRFENYLRLFGPKAFNVYRSVFELSFDDPQKKYEAVRSRIEDIANKNLIKLTRLEVEVMSPSAGRGRTAKSPQTRNLYKSLVKKAREEERLASKDRRTRDVIKAAPPPFGRVAIPTANDYDSSEYVTADEETTRTSFISDDTSESSSRTHDVRPALAFRVFDSNSKSKFTNDGSIVSQGLQLWNGTMPPAPNGGGVMDILLNNHLSMSRGGTSFYISVSISLLQVFNKASNMTKPSIAIIALNHPSLSAPGKLLYAKDVLLRLKRLGQAKWARRYRGTAEWLVFGQIPSKCIIHCLPLGDLIRLSDIYQDVGKLLHLREFRSGLRTLAVSQELSKHGIVLNASSGTAMARFALLFGLGTTRNFQHISAFCTRVVDGWSIKEATPQETNNAAWAFAVTFGSCIHSKQTVMEAFTMGVQDGFQSINYFAKRRRST